MDETRLHSAVFSVTVSSPSAINSSSSLSRASLCSGASWPKSLFVTPFKENVRTVCTAQESTELLYGSEAEDWNTAVELQRSEGRVLYPSSQLPALLLLRDQVLGGHLQLKLSQLMLPAHCPKKQTNKSNHGLSEYQWDHGQECGFYLRASA